MSQRTLVGLTASTCEFRYMELHDFLHVITRTCSKIRFTCDTCKSWIRLADIPARFLPHLQKGFHFLKANAKIRQKRQNELANGKQC